MLLENKKYIKSCINYTGGKFKLLKQIEPLFPKQINNFIDLFCGGANVAINVNSNNKITCIDNQKELIRLFNTLKSLPTEKTFSMIENIIEKFGLSNTFRYGYQKYGVSSSEGLANFNKDKYLKLRDYYNNRKDDSEFFDIVFYVLIVFGFNNQIRFNKKGHFNIPVGKRDFNINIRRNLKKFIKAIKEKDICFLEMDFRDFDFTILSSNDFLYADPPYLISTATYNEQNGWTESEELELINILDQLHQNGVKFALSNVLEHKGQENKILIDWLNKNKNKYSVNYLNYNYRNSNYQIKNRTLKTSEVLITNYKL